MKRNANVQVYRRAAAVLAVDEGRSVSEVATFLGVTRQSIYNWVATYGHVGHVSDLTDAPRAGRPTIWANQLDCFLKDALNNPPANFGYAESQWNAALLKRCLASRQGKEVSKETLRRQLRRLGYAWKRGRYATRQTARLENGAPISVQSSSQLPNNHNQADQRWIPASPPGIPAPDAQAA